MLHLLRAFAKSKVSQIIVHTPQKRIGDFVAAVLRYTCLHVELFNAELVVRVDKHLNDRGAMKAG